MINASSGEIQTNALLDHEQHAVIKLTVLAHDNGIPRKSEEVEVVIYLQDTNDNAPQFNQSLYHGKMRRFH